MQNSNNQSKATFIFDENALTMQSKRFNDFSVNHRLAKLPSLEYFFGEQEYLDLDDPELDDKYKLHQYFYYYWNAPYAYNSSINNATVFENDLELVFKIAETTFLATKFTINANAYTIDDVLNTMYAGLINKWTKQFKEDLEEKFKL